jgi:hypothetical protein
MIHLLLMIHLTALAMIHQLTALAMIHLTTLAKATYPVLP